MSSSRSTRRTPQLEADKKASYRDDVKEMLKDLKSGKKSVSPNVQEDGARTTRSGAVKNGNGKAKAKDDKEMQEVVKDDKEEELVDDEMEEDEAPEVKTIEEDSVNDEMEEDTSETKNESVDNDESAAADKEVKQIMDRADDEEEGEKTSDSDDIKEISPDDDAVAEVDSESKSSTTKKSTARKSFPSKSKDSEEPELVELSDDSEEIQSVNGSSSGDEDDEDDNEDDKGDPSKDPGEGATGFVDPDHLVPFRLGWVREVVRRKTKKDSASQYDIFYVPPPDTPYRTREAKRKRRSKADQDKYFEDFPNPQLSVINFNYVRKALGLNNAAYEVVRKANADDPPPQTDPKPAKPKEKPSNKGQKPSGGGKGEKGGKKSRVSYKEVDESSGLIESDDDSDIDFKEGFDLDMPLTLQVKQSTWGLRSENRKRRRYRDPQTCCTPPLAEDILWTGLDDDPMGIFTELGGRSSPTTPPPLRAMRLTPKETATKIIEALESVRAEAAKVEVLKEQELSEGMASHDVAIKKFRHFVTHANRNSFSKVTNTPFNRNNGGRQVNRSYMQPRGAGHNFMIKVKLPMQSINGKRPVVELVMEQNGKYQPIKFSNNMQVTESIPKSLFERANDLKKTFYQKATQIPRVGSKTLFLAVNPSANGIAGIPGISIPSASPQSRPQPLYNRPPTSRPRQPQPPTANHRPLNKPPFRPSPGGGGGNATGSSPSDQVSILVRPHKGPQSKPVLLNVPRSVAAKVKPGTTLSFSASNDQKYVVIDSKIHPPVRSGPSMNGSAPPPPPIRKPSLPLPLPLGMRQKAGPSVSRGVPFRNSNGSTMSGLNLPKSVSIRPVPATANKVNHHRQGMLNSGGNRRPLPNQRTLPNQPARRLSQPSSILSSGEVIGAKSPTEPCTPYCPGTSGFPELECQSCQSLFHAKCAGIPPSVVSTITSSFKCGNCDPSGRTIQAARMSARPQIIDLD